MSSVVYECSHCKDYSTLWFFAFNNHVRRCQNLTKQFSYENNLETYKCQNCNYEASWKVGYHSHTKTCCTSFVNETFEESKVDLKEPEEFKCHRCNFYTFSKYLFEIHRSKTDCWSTVADDGNIKCKECEKVVTKRNTLKQHVQSKHSGFIYNTKILFQCSCCSYLSPRRVCLVSHFMRVHTDPDQMKWFKCAQCSYKPKTRLDLKEHIFGKIGCRSNQITEKGYSREFITSAGSRCRYLFKCDYCSFTTKKNKRMTYHIDIKHLGRSEYNWYSCKLCLKNFRTTPNFVRYVEHVCDSINHIKWYKCNHCNYKTVRSTNLKSHMVGHVRPEKEFVCDKCSYKTYRRNNMNSHLQFHDSKNWYKCDYCEYKTKYKKTINDHILRHVPPKDEFVCNKCPYKTNREYYLRKHWQNKHSDVWYECAHCDYKTRLKYTLVGHFNSKHAQPENIVWYLCSYCPYKCKVKSTFNMHKRKFHTQKVSSQ